MKPLAQEPEIIRMADALRVGPGNAVENILRYCRNKVSKWCDEVGDVKTIDELERIVCGKLRLVFEEFYDDAGLQRIIQRYADFGEKIFKTLPDLFDENTFATLVERRKITGRSHDRYVAIIDCRGDKAWRRFFTRWHEIAHLLTLYNQLELPLHRSTNDKTPTERLMDAIAGDIGFFDSILRPIIDAEIRIFGRLTFDGVERIRTRYCPMASFQSTLNACVARLSKPAVLLDVGWGLKKAEAELVASPQLALIPCAPPQSKIRALSVMPNDDAHGKIEIHRNMELPATSVVSRLLMLPAEFAQDEAVENLEDWQHSDGKRLRAAVVHIQARRVKDHVVALLQLAIP